MNAAARQALLDLAARTLEVMLASIESNFALRNAVFELLEHHPENAEKILRKALDEDQTASKLNAAIGAYRALNVAIHEADDV